MGWRVTQCILNDNTLGGGPARKKLRHIFSQAKRNGVESGNGVETYISTTSESGANIAIYPMLLPELRTAKERKKTTMRLLTKSFENLPYCLNETTLRVLVSRLLIMSTRIFICCDFKNAGGRAPYSQC